MKGHLTPEQFVGALDGDQSEALATHLSVCRACAQKLADLRAAAGAIHEATVPEPTPLFWEHFSSRVHDTVQAEVLRGPSGSPWWSWLGTRQLWAGAALAAMLAVAVSIRVEQRAGSTAVQRTAAPDGNDVPFDVLGSPDDASLSLVADLAAGLSWEAAGDAGFTDHLGADDDALAQLSAGEQYELNQLLKGELGKAGGS